MWQWYAVIAMGCFAAMQLIFRYLSSRGFDSAAMLLVVFAFGALLYFVHVRAVKTPLPATMSFVAICGGAAVLSYVGNLYSARAVAAAPNPGYAVAIVGLQAAVVTVTAMVTVGASISVAKAVGVALCCLGIALLVI